MILNEPLYRNRRDNPNSSVKSKEKVYCMNVEYDYIRDLLMRDRSVWEKFQHAYWWRKYWNYLFTYNRIDDSYKKEYRDRMRQEFKRAIQLQQLCKEDFKPGEWREVENLVAGVNGWSRKIATIPFVRHLLPYIPQSAKRMIGSLLHLLMKGVYRLKNIF